MVTIFDARRMQGICDGNSIPSIFVFVLAGGGGFSLLFYAAHQIRFDILFLNTLSADMRRDVQEIFRVTPHHKQVMMFSATLSKDIRVTCKKFMANVRSFFYLLIKLLTPIFCLASRNLR